MYLPYNVHNNGKLYQPIDKSNLLAFYVYYLGCIVLKQGRKDGITNLPGRDHIDLRILGSGEFLRVHTLCMAMSVIPHPETKWQRPENSEPGVS